MSPDIECSFPSGISKRSSYCSPSLAAASGCLPLELLLSPISLPNVDIFAKSNGILTMSDGMTGARENSGEYTCSTVISGETSGGDCGGSDPLSLICYC
jgi:hypothetical protein